MKLKNYITQEEIDQIILNFRSNIEANQEEDEVDFDNLDYTFNFEGWVAYVLDFMGEEWSASAQLDLIAAGFGQDFSYIKEVK